MGVCEGMGHPFTQAQWRELERQAMIYKYMMASAAVPRHLLFPLPSVPDSHYSCKMISLPSFFSLLFTDCCRRLPLVLPAHFCLL